MSYIDNLVEIHIPIEVFLELKSFFQKHDNRIYELTGLSFTAFIRQTDPIIFEKDDWWKIHGVLQRAMVKHPHHKDWMIDVMSRIERTLNLK